MSRKIESTARQTSESPMRKSASGQPSPSTHLYSQKVISEAKVESPPTAIDERTQPFICDDSRQTSHQIPAGAACMGDAVSYALGLGQVGGGEYMPRLYNMMPSNYPVSGGTSSPTPSVIGGSVRSQSAGGRSNTSIAGPMGSATPGIQPGHRFAQLLDHQALGHSSHVPSAASSDSVKSSSGGLAVGVPFSPVQSPTTAAEHQGPGQPVKSRFASLRMSAFAGETVCPRSAQRAGTPIVIRPKASSAVSSAPAGINQPSAINTSSLAASTPVGMLNSLASTMSNTILSFAPTMGGKHSSATNPGGTYGSQEMRCNQAAPLAESVIAESDGWRLGHGPDVLSFKVIRGIYGGRVFFPNRTTRLPDGDFGECIGSDPDRMENTLVFTQSGLLPVHAYIRYINGARITKAKLALKLGNAVEVDTSASALLSTVDYFEDLEPKNVYPPKYILDSVGKSYVDPHLFPYTAHTGKASRYPGFFNVCWAKVRSDRPLPLTSGQLIRVGDSIWSVERGERKTNVEGLVEYLRTFELLCILAHIVKWCDGKVSLAAFTEFATRENFSAMDSTKFDILTLELKVLLTLAMLDSVKVCEETIRLLPLHLCYPNTPIEIRLSGMHFHSRTDQAAAYSKIATASLTETLQEQIAELFPKFQKSAKLLEEYMSEQSQRRKNVSQSASFVSIPSSHLVSQTDEQLPAAVTPLNVNHDTDPAFTLALQEAGNDDVSQAYVEDKENIPVQTINTPPTLSFPIPPKTTQEESMKAEEVGECRERPSTMTASEANEPRHPYTEEVAQPPPLPISPERITFGSNTANKDCIVGYHNPIFMTRVELNPAIAPQTKMPDFSDIVDFPDYEFEETDMELSQLLRYENEAGHCRLDSAATVVRSDTPRVLEDYVADNDAEVYFDDVLSLDENEVATPRDDVQINSVSTEVLVSEPTFPAMNCDDTLNFPVLTTSEVGTATAKQDDGGADETASTERTSENTSHGSEAIEETEDLRASMIVIEECHPILCEDSTADPTCSSVSVERDHVLDPPSISTDGNYNVAVISTTSSSSRSSNSNPVITDIEFPRGFKMDLDSDEMDDITSLRHLHPPWKSMEDHYCAGSETTAERTSEPSSMDSVGEAIKQHANSLLQFRSIPDLSAEAETPSLSVFLDTNRENRLTPEQLVDSFSKDDSQDQVISSAACEPDEFPTTPVESVNSGEQYKGTSDTTACFELCPDGGPSMHELRQICELQPSAINFEIDGTFYDDESAPNVFQQYNDRNASFSENEKTLQMSFETTPPTVLEVTDYTAFTYSNASDNVDEGLSEKHVTYEREKPVSRVSDDSNGTSTGLTDDPSKSAGSDDDSDGLPSTASTNNVDTELNHRFASFYSLDATMEAPNVVKDDSRTISMISEICAESTEINQTDCGKNGLIVTSSLGESDGCGGITPETNNEGYNNPSAINSDSLRAVCGSESEEDIAHASDSCDAQLHLTDYAFSPPRPPNLEGGLSMNLDADLSAWFSEFSPLEQDAENMYLSAISSAAEHRRLTYASTVPSPNNSLDSVNDTDICAMVVPVSRSPGPSPVLSPTVDAVGAPRADSENAARNNSKEPTTSKRRRSLPELPQMHIKMPDIVATSPDVEQQPANCENDDTTVEEATTESQMSLDNKTKLESDPVEESPKELQKLATPDVDCQGNNANTPHVTFAGLKPPDAAQSPTSSAMESSKQSILRILKFNSPASDPLRDKIVQHVVEIRLKRLSRQSSSDIRKRLSNGSPSLKDTPRVHKQSRFGSPEQSFDKMEITNNHVSEQGLATLNTHPADQRHHVCQDDTTSTSSAVSMNSGHSMVDHNAGPFPFVTTLVDSIDEEGKNEDGSEGKMVEDVQDECQERSVACCPESRLNLNNTLKESPTEERCIQQDNSLEGGTTQEPVNPYQVDEVMDAPDGRSPAFAAVSQSELISKEESTPPTTDVEDEEMPVVRIFPHYISPRTPLTGPLDSEETSVQQKIFQDIESLHGAAPQSAFKLSPLVSPLSQRDALPSVLPLNPRDLLSQRSQESFEGRRIAPQPIPFEVPDIHLPIDLSAHPNVQHPIPLDLQAGSSLAVWPVALTTNSLPLLPRDLNQELMNPNETMNQVFSRARRWLLKRRKHPTMHEQLRQGIATAIEERDEELRKRISDEYEQVCAAPEWPVPNCVDAAVLDYHTNTEFQIWFERGNWWIKLALMTEDHDVDLLHDVWTSMGDTSKVIETSETGSTTAGSDSDVQEENRNIDRPAESNPGIRRHLLAPGDIILMGDLCFLIQRFKTGVGGLQGFRVRMEDEEVILQDCCVSNGFPVSLISVYDGHGGRECATFVKSELHRHFIRQLELLCGDPLYSANITRDIFQALFRAFVITDRGFLHKMEAEMRKEPGAGSAAVVVVVAGDLIFCANCGDARAVLSRDGVAIDLSEDHKPDRKSEQQRIEQSNGYVKSRRVLGRLAVSRALGDREYKRIGKGVPPLVIPEPEIRAIQMDLQRDEFIIVACDGIFDVFTSQQVVDFVLEKLSTMPPEEQDPQIVMSRLVEEAVDKRRSRDNVTAILCLLRRDVYNPTRVCPPSPM